MAERKVLYIDPWMGVAGDMLMAALLDGDRGNGRLESVLRDAMAAMGLDPQIVSVRTEVDQGISCTGISVSEEDNAPLRHLEDLLGIIDGSSLPERVQEKARAAFRRLAEVEASVHGCAVDHIHFHEVGAVDTLVDVVGVLSLVDALGVESVGVGVIPVGGGAVTISHGRMSVPAPATAALLMGYETVGGPEMRELTTPTGALLIGQLGARSGPMPAMTCETVGYGCGTMKFHSGPNVLRVMVGVESGRSPEEPRWGHDEVVELESNIDDVSAEVVGYVCGRLRSAGALEVWTTPAFMKKDRPGVVLHALVVPADALSLSALIVRETGSLGVRRQVKSRVVAERGTVAVKVGGTEVRVKWGRHEGALISVAAEYDSAAAAADATGLPLKDVMVEAAQQARSVLAGGSEVAS
jgi:pyridinium-3,5-bisthiocarboxylic acid mononucleotide nickel chelatase